MASTMVLIELWTIIRSKLHCIAKFFRVNILIPQYCSPPDTLGRFHQIEPSLDWLEMVGGVENRHGFLAVRKKHQPDLLKIGLHQLDLPPQRISWRLFGHNNLDLKPPESSMYSKLLELRQVAVVLDFPSKFATKTDDLQGNLDLADRVG
jgi:hypothetical protein